MPKEKNNSKKYNKRYTVKALMKDIRDNDHISIWGSNGKRDLLLMGFFHGYRTIKPLVYENPSNYPDNKVPFKRIKQIYDTDLKLKSFFYPILMQLETAIANYVIDIIVNENRKHLYSLDSLFKYYLNSFEDIKPKIEKKKSGKVIKLLSRKKRKKRDTLTKRKLNLRKTFDSAVVYGWKNRNKGVRHYIKKRKPIPIWIIFELISLGNLGSFLQCLNKPIRYKIEVLLHIAHKYNKNKKNDKKYNKIYKEKYNKNNYNFVFESIFLLKDLRNAVAHNKIIINCKFQHESPAKNLPKKLAKSFHLNKFYKSTKYNNGTPGYLTFHSIIDYFILLIYFQNKIGLTKRPIYKEITKLTKIIKKFKNNESYQTYKNILCIDGDALKKLKYLKKSIRKFNFNKQKKIY